jgi:hypothetical protein
VEAGAAAEPRTTARLRHSAPRTADEFVAVVVNACNDRHQTPLMLAASNGHERCVELLLEQVGDRPGVPATAWACLRWDGGGMVGCLAAVLRLQHHNRQLTNRGHSALPFLLNQLTTTPSLTCRAPTPGLWTTWGAVQRCTMRPSAAAWPWSTCWWTRPAPAGGCTSPTGRTPGKHPAAGCPAWGPARACSAGRAPASQL